MVMYLGITYAAVVFLSIINGNVAFYHGNVKRSSVGAQSKLQLYAAAKKVKVVKVSNEINKEAYDCWFSLNGRMNKEAPNFLTEEKCKVKFTNLVNAGCSPEDALKIVKIDPTVLNYREKTVAEAFEAWTVKLKSNQETVELCVRNPPVLSFKASAIENINPGDLAQTQFWSYFAVATRPLTLGLQKLIRVNY